jgi:hypothetical protein
MLIVKPAAAFRYDPAGQNRLASPMIRIRVASLFAVAIACSGGCGGPRESPMPEAAYDPDAMAQAAIREFDKNGNGALELTELDGCPALKSAFAGIDTDRDRKLSREELQARFTAYRNLGTVTAPVNVTLNGAPLAGATVTFIPEPCMLGTLLELSGQTGEDGSVREYTAKDGKMYAGVQAGLYKVSITKAGTSIPSKYNEKTTLGAEVYGGRGSSSLKFVLTDP